MLEFKPTSFGEYLLQDRIGAGGMAEIFLATAQGIEGFEKLLVIKRILPTLSDDEQFVRMFVEEAKLCVSLHHPNIVQVYDLGLIDGQYFIAMEYVDGRDLLKTLAACGRKKIGFPTDIALYIIMEVLKGLEYAHQLKKDGESLGIIHRDVSPSNVLLSFEGEVKLGDFGIAKARTRERTATGILKGKFGYMAPEQVTGVPIDFKADIFAVGILLYELLTGHRLFAGKNDLAVLERVRKADISPPPREYRPDLDDELESIVTKALARDPAQRFESCIELHDALHDYVFRSRATVGPSQLALFMQKLFLKDQEERARRGRLRLPPIPGVGAGAGAKESHGHDYDDASASDEGQRFADLTNDDLRRKTSITDGRELFDPPRAPNGRPETPHPALNGESARPSKPPPPPPPTASQLRRIADQPTDLEPLEVADEPPTAELKSETTGPKTGDPLKPPMDGLDDLDRTVLNDDVDEGPSLRGEKTTVDQPTEREDERGTERAPPADGPWGPGKGASLDHDSSPFDPVIDPGLSASAVASEAPTSTQPDDEWADKTIANPAVLDENVVRSVATAPGRPFDSGVANEPTVNGSLEEHVAVSTSIGVFTKGGVSKGAIESLASRERPPILGPDGALCAPSVEHAPTEVPPPDPKGPGIPAITDAGRLSDDGASGLFGALSVLDNPPTVEIADDDTPAGDNVENSHSSESLKSGEPLDSRPLHERSESSFSLGAESGSTRMGLLASPFDDESLPGYASNGEEPTQAASDQDALAVAQEVRSELPEPADSGAERDPLAAVRLSRTFRNNDDESASTVDEAAVIAPLGEEPTQLPRRFTEEEPTESTNAATGDTPLADLDPGRVKAGPELVSDSFELQLEPSLVAKAPARSNLGESEPPVRPVSMVHAPGGVEETDSQVMVQAPLIARAPNRGAEALRAVVGRKGRIRELNRAQHRAAGRPPENRLIRGRPATADMTPILPNLPNPAPARRSARERGPAAPQRSIPAASWTGGPTASPPPMIVHQPRSAWLTAAVYGLPLLAILLTVAALVSAVVMSDRSSVPVKRPTGRVILVPDRPSEPSDRRTEITEPASSGSSDVSELAGSPAAAMTAESPPGAPTAESTRPEDLSAPATDPSPEPALKEPGTPPAPAIADLSRELTKRPAQSEGKDAATAPAVGSRPESAGADTAAPPATPTTSRIRKLGLLRVQCDEPTIVRIVGKGAYRADPTVLRRLPPGNYQVKLSRRGRVLKKVAIEIVTEQTVTVPCI